MRAQKSGADFLNFVSQDSGNPCPLKIPPEQEISNFERFVGGGLVNENYLSGVKTLLSVTNLSHSPPAQADITLLIVYLV